MSAGDFATTRKGRTPLQPSDHQQEAGHNEMRSGHHPFRTVPARSRADGNVYPTGFHNGQHRSANGCRSKQARPPKD
jgi:hypothetical protein